MSLFVCRHGETEANASGLLLGRVDPELNETGSAQAEAIASAIADVGRVVSSPLQRCRSTAAAFGKPVEVDERLLELDYGQYDLQPITDIPPEVWDRWRSDVHFRPPGGESLFELGARVGECLAELVPGAVGDNVVVVTHVSPIKAALAWALDVSMTVSWRSFVAQASISEISVSGPSPSLRLFNSVAHLDRAG